MRGGLPDSMIGVRRYSGPNRSGICKCGHSWRDHHLGVVMNVEHYEATGESYVPQECEFFGCNEMGGLDRDGNDHCGHYVDMMEEKEMNWFTKLFRKTFATVKGRGVSGVPRGDTRDESNRGQGRNHCAQGCRESFAC